MGTAESENIDVLQRSADYYAFKKSMKAAGVSCIILGLLVLLGMFLSGILSVDTEYYFHGAISFFGAFIGLSISIIGIFSLNSSNSTFLLLSGIGLLIITAIAIVNFIGLFYFLTQGILLGGIISICVGVSIYFWSVNVGISSLQQYRRFSSVSIVRPSSHMLLRTDTTFKQVTKAKVAAESDYIQLVQPGIPYVRFAELWIVKLSEPYCIVTSRDTKNVFFASPKDFAITPRQKLIPNKKQKVWLRVRDFNYKMTIRPIFWQRYELWKKSIQQPF